MSARLLALGALALALTGCARCSDDPAASSTGAASASSPVSVSAPLPARTPPPAPWPLATVRGPPGVAAPSPCRQRAPLLRAKVPVTTHFAADARSPGLLAVAETELDPPAVLRSGALAHPAAPGLPPAAPSATSPAPDAGAPDPWVPWPHPRSAPRLARLADRWIAAWQTPTADASTVFLHRGAAAPIENLGTGDAYLAADLACGAARCALLTSRRARVAPAGADVLLFDATPTPPRAVPLEPPAGTQARPFGLAAVDGPRGPVAVLTEGPDAVFWTVEGDGAPAAFARLPAEHGLLEAILLADRPLALAHGNVVDEKGCAREGSDASGAKLRLLRAPDPPIDLSTPGPPILAALRPLPKGALALWLSPLGCAAPRHVLFAVLLDPTGAPASSPVPIGDADTFAAAASGPEVDLWIRRSGEVSWLRLTCDSP